MVFHGVHTNINIQWRNGISAQLSAYREFKSFRHHVGWAECHHQHNSSHRVQRGVATVWMNMFQTWKDAWHPPPCFGTPGVTGSLIRITLLRILAYEQTYS